MPPVATVAGPVSASASASTTTAGGKSTDRCGHSECQRPALPLSLPLTRRRISSSSEEESHEQHLLRCFVRVSPGCKRVGGPGTSRWYHVSPFEHFCNSCFEHHYRRDPAGKKTFEAWSQNRRRDPACPSKFSSINRFMMELYLPRRILCQLCQRWRLVFLNEMKPEAKARLMERLRDKTWSCEHHPEPALGVRCGVNDQEHAFGVMKRLLGIHDTSLQLDRLLREALTKHPLDLAHHLEVDVDPLTLTWANLSASMELKAPSKVVVARSPAAPSPIPASTKRAPAREKPRDSDRPQEPKVQPQKARAAEKPAPDTKDGFLVEESESEDEQTLDAEEGTGDMTYESLRQQNIARNMAMMNALFEGKSISQHVAPKAPSKKRRRPVAQKVEVERRRSLRLSSLQEGATKVQTVSLDDVDYSSGDEEEGRDHKARKLKFEGTRVGGAGGSGRKTSESYTTDDLLRLGTSKTMYRVKGPRIWSPQNGSSCHQCRQKTLDEKASCAGCGFHWCGVCLQNRYGENLDELNAGDVPEASKRLEDDPKESEGWTPNWSCPFCRNLCNCSFCRLKAGYGPTGALAQRALALGYISAAHYLVHSKQRDPEAYQRFLTEHPEIVLQHRCQPVETTSDEPVMEGLMESRWAIQVPIFVSKEEKAKLAREATMGNGFPRPEEGTGKNGTSPGTEGEGIPA